MSLGVGHPEQERRDRCDLAPALTPESLVGLESTVSQDSIMGEPQSLMVPAPQSFMPRATFPIQKELKDTHAKTSHTYVLNTDSHAHPYTRVHMHPS